MKDSLEEYRFQKLSARPIRGLFQNLHTGSRTNVIFLEKNMSHLSQSLKSGRMVEHV